MSSSSSSSSANASSIISSVIPAARTFSSISFWRARGLLDHAARVVLALCKSLAVVGEPRSALFDNVARDRKIDDLAALRYSLSVENVEFRHAEGGATLFFTTLTLTRFP